MAALANAALGFCWWDLPAALLLAAVIAVYVADVGKLRRQQRELEDRLAGLCADESVPID